jgi:two-component system cell cycle response regulator DivK
VIATCGAPLPSADGSNARFTILCIEDDPVISKLYELRLRASGAQVLCSTNGCDGYSVAVRSNPDLILLDNELPDGQGVDLLARLRKHPSLVDVPVVMLTGADARTIRHRLLAHGVLDLLTKPVNFDELFRQIDRLAASPRESKLKPQFTSPAGNG